MWYSKDTARKGSFLKSTLVRRGKEEEFSVISRRITRAWEEMGDEGYLRYQSLSDGDVRRLIEDGKVKPGEESIAVYLKAVGELKKLSR